jgi:hypothetical protein
MSGPKITSSIAYRDGENVVRIDTSHTVDGFGIRMRVNDHSEREWVFHHPPHGPSELVQQAEDGTYYAFFWPFWEGYFPIDTVVKLVPCETT